jgi:hypothetical protein
MNPAEAESLMVVGTASSCSSAFFLRLKNLCAHNPSRLLHAPFLLLPAAARYLPAAVKRSRRSSAVVMDQGLPGCLVRFQLTSDRWLTTE